MTKADAVTRRYCFQPQAVARMEVRADDERPRIAGYAAVFFDEQDRGTEFDVFGDDSLVERILPGAFDRAIREADDVRALFNHAPDNLLGRTDSGTLHLSVDSRGLRYEINPPETQLGKQVTVAINRGDLTGSSFAFTVEEQSFREMENHTIREIASVRLFDVGPVTFPAYQATSTEVAKRSLKEWRKEATRNWLWRAKRRLRAAVLC